MKKLIKLIASITFLALLFGCNITLAPIENNITITNNTGGILHTMYLVPDVSYLGYTSYSFAKNNAISFGSADLLDFDGLSANEQITIDLNDYSGSSFKIMSFEDSNQYTNPYFYVITITDDMNSATIYSSDRI